MKLALFAYSRGGCTMARRVLTACPEAEWTCYTMARFDEPGFLPLDKAVYAVCFAAMDGLVFVGACGIAVREIAPEIGQLAEVGMKMQTRGPLPLPERPYDYRHTPAELLSALAQILLRGTGESAPEENETLRRAAPKPIIFSVREKSEQLLGLLRKNGHMSLGSMFGICKSRSELVATFLSVLELCSDGHIRVSGEEGNYDVSRALTDTEE